MQFLLVKGYQECINGDKLTVFLITYKCPAIDINDNSTCSGDMSVGVFYNMPIYDITNVIYDHGTNKLDDLGIKYNKNIVTTLLTNCCHDKNKDENICILKNHLFKLNNNPIYTKGYALAILTKIDSDIVCAAGVVAIQIFANNKISKAIIFGIFNDIYSAKECADFIKSNYINRPLQDLKDYYTICPFIKNKDIIKQDITDINLGRI